jgi:hypothetical protein
MAQNVALDQLYIKLECGAVDKVQFQELQD